MSKWMRRKLFSKISSLHNEKPSRFSTCLANQYIKKINQYNTVKLNDLMDN